ncbi:MAG: amidohydrolase family protein [Planctomycetota bacterium]
MLKYSLHNILALRFATAMFVFILALSAAAWAQGSRPASRTATQPAPESTSSKPADTTKEEELLAIVGGDVETVTMGRLRGATILIKGSKIWKVGRNIDIPEKAKRIDARGYWVYPGLVAPRASNITAGGFGAGGKLGDRYDPFSLSVLGTIAGGITTIYQSDTIIKLSTKSVEDLVLKDNACVRFTYNTAQNRYETRERFERARNYLFELREFEARKAANDKDAKEPKKDGVDETTLRLLKREIPARFEIDRASEMMPILELLDEYRFDCVFSGCLEAWTIPNELSRRGVKCILSPRRREQRDERRETLTGSSIEASAILAKAGVEFSFYPPPGFDGGDIITWGGIAGRDLQTFAMEGAWAIRGGLDEHRALEAITISPARIMGVEHRIGSIEPGKDADIIITDGPIFDFRTYTQTAIVNGVVQYEKSKVSLFKDIRPPQKPPTEVPAYPVEK